MPISCNPIEYWTVWVLRQCSVVNNTWYQRPIVLEVTQLQAALAYLSTTQLVRPDWFPESIVSTVTTTLRTTRIIVHRIKLSGSSESTVVVSCSQDQDVSFQLVCCGGFMFTGSGCKVAEGLLWSLCSQEQDMMSQRVCRGWYMTSHFINHLQVKVKGWAGLKYIWHL